LPDTFLSATVPSVVDSLLHNIINKKTPLIKWQITRKISNN